ncbi:MAG: NAD(P)-binding domain-containing protein [Alphaproteobacteria bacterium]|nr:NAD(P)-binding domain-containing protein [Alphaproteobacteria bacterium]
MIEAATRAERPPPLPTRLLGRGLELGVLTVALLALAMPLLPLVMWGLGAPLAAVAAVGAGVALWWGGFWVDQLRLLRPAPAPAPTPAPPEGRVIILGAGPAGLVTLKECLELGLDAVCLERASSIGGVFRFEEHAEGGSWASVRFTSSAAVTAFSDLPPEGENRHLTRAGYVAYLERYVERFGLRPHLRLEHEVRGLRAHPEGGWEVEVVAGGEPQRLRAARLAICTGANQHPKPIALPGLEGFAGEVLHVARYKRPEPFAGRRVVVVGMGESAVDIAAELSEVAAEVTLSARRGAFIIPRVNPLTGAPNDQDTNRARYATPLALRDAYARFKRWTCGLTGAHDARSAARARLLACSGVGPFSQPATKSAGFIEALLEGKLRLRREPIDVQGSTLRFADGAQAEADVLLFAHGFSAHAPGPEPVGEQQPGGLYLKVFHPELGDRAAWIGFARPSIGAIPPTAEMQARWFARVAAGLCTLPPPEEMRAAIALGRAEHARRFPLRPWPDIIVEWLPYMDALAERVGCRPQPWRLLRDPPLAWRVMTGPVCGAHYRLHGPAPSPSARGALLDLPGRHGAAELLTLVGLHLACWPLAWRCPNPRLRSGTGFI